VGNTSIDKKKLNSTSHPARLAYGQQEVLSLCLRTICVDALTPTRH